jgi:hypothetical protein
MNSETKFGVPVARGQKLGPEYNPWYWNPNRIGVQFGDKAFTSKLKALGEELETTFNPITQRWQVWSRYPKMQHPICQGWRLLFVHKGAEGEYLPLDERVIARLVYASVLTHGSAKEYFDRVQHEYERDLEKRKANSLQETLDMATPHFDYSQIKVGYGKSNGSKFSTYFS